MSNDADSKFENEELDDTDIGDLVTKNLDSIDYEIYRILNEDGRISDTELGERIDLSRTAVRRRRKKLQEENVIKILGVLVLQEVDLNYADVQVTLRSDTSRESIDEFIEFLVRQELVYEVDEYLGSSDMLVRVWHRSLQDIKQYVNKLLQSEIVQEYEIIPVTRTHKAWHSEINGGRE